MIRVPTAGVLLALFGLPATAWPQGTRWQRQVRAQLDRTVAALRGNSPESAQVMQVGPLNTEESDSFVVELKAGTAYDIVGACDEDCTQLDLRLSNGAGSDMAVDRAGENLPAVHFTPSESAVYRVRVTMAACRLNPCWYGVAIRALRAPPAPRALRAP
jgi:hypothetical protein